MLSYLIVTYLLSIIGFLFYKFFIADKVSLIKQRKSLHIILLGCLIVPLLVSFSYSDNFINKKFIDEQENYVDVCENFCPNEEAINQCFDIAIMDEHFCNCISVEKENIIVYEGNNFLNFFISNEKILKDGFLSLGVIIFILLLFKIISLNIIIRKSDKSVIEIKGEKFVLLKPNINLPVSSFRLFNKYIIWDDNLNYLSEAEKTAIFYYEIAHIKNHDTWYKILENLLNVVWFVNPIFYLLKKELQNLSEFLADEFAVEKIGNVNFYANLLLKIKKKEALALVHQFNNGSFTKVRIQKLLKQQTASGKFVFHKVFLTIFLFAIISNYSLDFLNKENSKLTIYKKLFHKNSETGKSVFCKQCLYEEFKKF